MIATLRAAVPRRKCCRGTHRTWWRWCEVRVIDGNLLRPSSLGWRRRPGRCSVNKPISLPVGFMSIAWADVYFKITGNHLQPLIAYTGLIHSHRANAAVAPSHWLPPVHSYAWFATTLQRIAIVSITVLLTARKPSFEVAPTALAQRT